jgi:hypothetical protein
MNTQVNAVVNKVTEVMIAQKNFVLMNVVLLMEHVKIIYVFVLMNFSVLIVVKRNALITVPLMENAIKTLIYANVMLDILE